MVKPKNKDIAKVVIRKGLVKSLEEGVIKNLICSCSGGKDSMATIMRLIDMGIPKDKIIVNFVNTDLEFYGIFEYIKYCCKKLGIKNVNKKEHKDKEKVLNEFYEKAREFGDTLFLRYCEATLKHPLYQNGKLQDGYVNCIGVRWAESINRARRTFWQYNSGELIYNPIMDLNSKEVFDLFRKYDIPLFWTYKYLIRLSCVLCPNMLARKNVPIDLILSLQHKDQWNVNFFHEWFKNMDKFDDSVYKKMELKRNYRKIMQRVKRYILDENNDELKDIKINERNIPDMKFWQPKVRK